MRPKSIARFEWAWIGLIFALLFLAGLVRYWRDSTFQSLASESKAPPVPLKDFPERLDRWKAVKGSDAILEADVVRIAGASEHLIRIYVDEQSGQEAAVMLIYGLASRVFAHTPEACYPANGFKSSDTPVQIKIPRPGTEKQALFQRESFTKFKPGERDYRTVYHSFRNAGEWDVYPFRKYKVFRYYPAMYKVQVQVQGAPGQLQKDEEAIENLLTSIVREIDGYAIAKN